VWDVIRTIYRAPLAPTPPTTQPTSQGRSRLSVESDKPRWKDNRATDEVIQQRLEEAPQDEAVKERLEREHGELLEDLRALIPGAQVLFGFLLAIRFTSPFTDLSTVQRYVYYGTLLTTAVALVFLLAPSAYHRLRFREGDKDAMVRKGNREAIAGTGAIALAFTGVLYLITDLVFTTQAAIAVALVFFALTAWRWWAIALYRKAREQAAAKQT
jgi:hypothetical protein